MLNITNQGNVNQGHNETSPQTCQKNLSSKRQQITNIGEDVEKKEVLYTIGGNVNWYSHYGKQFGDSSKNKNRTTI